MHGSYTTCAERRKDCGCTFNSIQELSPRCWSIFACVVGYTRGMRAWATSTALWGADIVDRLELNVHSQLGTVQLIDTGDP